MSEFAVANGRRLMHARSGFEADDAVAFVFELDPSFQHIHELKGRSVQMRLTGEGVSLCGANQMRIDATVGRLLDSEIAIFEEGPEPALELRVPGVRRDKASLGHGEFTFRMGSGDARSSRAPEASDIGRGAATNGRNAFPKYSQRRTLHVSSSSTGRLS